jgi:putative MATE family efflux protein
VRSPSLQSPLVTKPTSDHDRQPGTQRSRHCAIEPDPPIDDGFVVEEANAPQHAEGVIRSGKLAGRTMWSAIWILSWPVLLQQTATAFLGLVDKILAGNLPAGIRVAALDGLGIGAYIGWFIGIAMMGLGIGGQALIARAMGAGNREESHGALGQTMSLSMIWGALVGVLLWFGAPVVAGITGLTDEAAVHCIDYIRVLAYAMPAAGVMLVGMMCLHGAGETTMPSIISVVANIVNVVVSYILSGADLTYGAWSIENPFGFDWHVSGIAAGTAFSYLAGAILTLVVLRRGVRDLRLETHDLGVKRKMAWRIVRIGVPSFLEGISMWAVNLIVLKFIGGMQVPGYQGAHIIAVQWEAFSFLPGFAIGTAAGALAGQYLGAGNVRMARKAVLVCAGIGALVMGVLGVVFMLAGEPLTRLISAEPVHMELVPDLLFIAGFTQVFFAVALIIRQGLRGTGDTTWALIITTVSSYGCRLPAAWFLGVHLEFGMRGIWIALCGEFVIRAGLFLARFLHGGWARKQI